MRIGLNLDTRIYPTNLVGQVENPDSFSRVSTLQSNWEREARRNEPTRQVHARDSNREELQIRRLSSRTGREAAFHRDGDTLSKISKEYLGDANEYMRIFDANTDQLSDPDKIKPGQVLKIPAMDKQLT